MYETQSNRTGSDDEIEIFTAHARSQRYGDAARSQRPEIARNPKKGIIGKKQNPIALQRA